MSYLNGVQRALMPAGPFGGSAWAMSPIPTDYQVVPVDDIKDAYAGSDVPGEWRSLTDALATEQLAVSCIRVPPHSDFDQGTGHFHDETEELYLVTGGTLTMRFGDEIRHVSAPAAVRVAPQTPRSTYRNEGDEPVEAWAISRRHGGHDATKLDDFWEASPEAAQQR
jgi:mannose-6-phosphate isomerase-like protein (cupin superfamily)